MAKKLSTSSESKVRTRNWTFILYPESSPENWRDLINEHHIEWVEGPLHDKDFNPTGEKKKPHRHILLLFGGVKTYEQVLSVIEPLNGTIPQKVQNTKSLVRYMAHLDNPEKVQYLLSDIKAYGGVDLSDLLSLSKSERYSLIREMISFINQHNIIEYEDFVTYAAEEHFQDWFPLLCDSCSYVIGQFIKSKRHKRQYAMHDSSLNVCSETGEIID